MVSADGDAEISGQFYLKREVQYRWIILLIFYIIYTKNIN